MAAPNVAKPWRQAHSESGGDDSVSATISVPITSYLAPGAQFDLETKRVMGVAFEMACAALKLLDGGDVAKETVAKRIIELARAGELDPNRLCEQCLANFS